MITLTWQSVAGVKYFLERASDLGALPAYTPMATNILGQPGSTTFTDTKAFAPGRFFYRIGVGD
jgi:hypothetical protein